MKVVAVLMVLIGVALGVGAVLEFRYFGSDAAQFWVGAFTTPAAAFFAVAGLVLWLRGVRARYLVLAAALGMASATIGATALEVMGRPATMVGIIGSLIVMGWFWRTRKLVAE